MQIIKTSETEAEKVIINLSQEKSHSKDVSIMVDALRASTTVTIALDYFKEVIPAFTPEEARELSLKHNAVLAGERKGVKLEGFDIGNSPGEIKEFETNKKSMVLTTSNGIMTMENMQNPKHVLVGGFINAKSVAKAAVELAEEEIEIVMGGYNHEFAIEDFLAAGEILFYIEKELKERNMTPKENDGSNYELKDREGFSEYAISAILASRNLELSNEQVLKSKSGKRLSYLNYSDDVELCMKRNITENVGILKDGKIVLY